jgi:SAM-dependent methyltransferase
VKSVRCIASQGSSPSPSSSSTNNSRTTSFGFRTVPKEEKESLVKDVFDSVASSYDLMNDASSLGVHRLWKDTFVSSLRPGRKGPKRCLDVAGGTGDIALRILDYAREKHADRETVVEVVDINAEMLREGVRRFKKTMYHNSEYRKLRSTTTLSHYFQHLRFHSMRLMRRRYLQTSLPTTVMISIPLLLEFGTVHQFPLC